MAYNFRLAPALRAVCKIITVLIIFCASNNVQAVTALMSHTIFYLPSTDNNGIASPYAEVYWQINPLSIHYHKDENGKLISQIKTDIVIRNDTGIVAEEHYFLNTTPQFSGAASTQNIFDLRRFKIPYGKCSLSVTLAEPSFPNDDYHYDENISVPHSDAAALYSSLQLIDTLLPSDKNTSIFYRNNFLQIPLVTNFIDEGRKTIWLYTELYQDLKKSIELMPYTQTIYISRREDEQAVFGLQETDTMQSAAITPVYHKFNLSTLPSGNYYINIKLFDKYKQEVAYNSYFFQLINKNPVQPETQKKSTDTSHATIDTTPTTYLDLNKTFVSKFTLPQAKAILEMIKPLSPPDEIKSINDLLKKPDELYLRYFIYNHFSKIDGKNPEKAWLAYADKIREVNKLFGEGNEPGYKTDRGYVYLKYGKPNDRVVVNNEQGALPYEVWQYYAVGKSEQEGIFLFYQPPSAVSGYKLLHTTVIGEIRNTAWRAYLYYKGSSNSSTNSRAEQYIRNR